MSRVLKGAGKLMEFKSSVDEMLADINENLKNLKTDTAFEIIHNFVHEVEYLNIFEPGLRYWQADRWSEFPSVYASTRDEKLFYNNVTEITMEEFQELRLQEWAQLSQPTNPIEETPNEKENSDNPSNNSAEESHSSSCRCHLD